MSWAADKFQIHEWMNTGRWCCANGSPARNYRSSSRTCRPAASAWRPVAARTTGGRKLSAREHETLLIASQFVKAYVKGSKTDAADAEAIYEAVSRPNMRFAPVKNPEQQALLAVHRALASFVKARTIQANQMRGLLAECKVPANPSSPSCLARKT